MQKFLSIIKKKKVWIPTLCVVAIILIISLTGGNGVSGKTVKVEKGEVLSEVSLTGKVKPIKSVDLAFEKSGRLSRIDVQVGQKVSTGQTLLVLDNADVRAQVMQAQAQYDSQLARLAELKKGTTKQELAVSETSLENAYQAGRDALYDAYNKSEDAIKAQTDEFFLYDEERSPQIAFASTETDANILASQYRYQAGLYLSDLHNAITSVPDSNRASLESLLKDSQVKIKYFLALFSYLDTSLNGANGLTSTARAAYKAYITAGRTELNAALSGISTKEQAIAAAKRNLELTESGSTDEAIEYQEAQVAQALANVSYAQSQYAKTVIQAPFEGVVTKIPFSKGDIVQPQAVAVSLIGTGAYQIETNVTESDIAKIKTGHEAVVTLDAYTDDLEFKAKVVQIDLSETIIEGVPTYKTTLQFEQEDERIVSGMTANIDITSEKRENVLFVPTRNILSKDGKKFVKKAKDETGELFDEVEISTGLRGSDGRTEVISGISEGDLVVAE